jgi:hypothetical protein
MVNLLRCDASPWRGDNELCRWCNAAPIRAANRFCSRECVQAYADNHVYARGRILTIEASKGRCDCPPPITSRLGYIADGVMKYHETWPHPRCAACGECEGQVIDRGDTLSVNHIEPRYGIPMGRPDCIHHLTNLEVLCWHDHALLNKLGNVRSRLDDFLSRD